MGTKIIDGVATKNYVDTNKGTKLYRHKISFTDDYHELNIDLNIVSTNGDVSSKSSFKNLLENAISVSGFVNNYNYLEYIGFGNDTEFDLVYCVVKASVSFNKAQVDLFTDVGIFEDTVTEL